MGNERLKLNFDLRGYLHCPQCGKLFSKEHAERKPNYCEECGQALKWEDE